MTPVAAAVLGAAYIERDDARAVPWADPRFDKFASVAARCLVSAAETAWPPPARDGDGLVGVYLASGETGLDVHAFLDAAHVAWDEHPDTPDYARMGGRALRAIDPYYSLRTLANGPAALLAMHLGATGPSVNFAQQPCSVAWALLSAIDDLRAQRCAVAVVAACDTPSIPTRQVLARRRGRVVPPDAAAVIVLGQPGGTGTHWAVRWEPPGEREDVAETTGDRSVVEPLRTLVRRGEAAAWVPPLGVVIDDDGCRAVIAAT